MLEYAQEQIREDDFAKKHVNYVNADANCTLMAFTSTGRFRRFNSEFGFDMLLLEVDNSSRLSERIYDTIGKEFAKLHPWE